MISLYFFNMFYFHHLYLYVIVFQKCENVPWYYWVKQKSYINGM